MRIRNWLQVVAVAAVAGAATSASAEDIRLRIASGHPPVNTYANLMQNVFAPEVTKCVAARTKHKVEFVHGYVDAAVRPVGLHRKSGRLRSELAA